MFKFPVLVRPLAVAIATRINKKILERLMNNLLSKSVVVSLFDKKILQEIQLLCFYITQMQRHEWSITSLNNTWRVIGRTFFANTVANCGCHKKTVLVTI